MSRDYGLRPFRKPAVYQIDYARELNPQQLEAVEAPPGPALVIAGAGSGKTRTLTYRVAYLLEQGIPASRLLLLTFTNKAAREMMRRVGELLPNDLTALWGGTFHSIGNRILRIHAEILGYPRHFTILDRDDASQLLGTCVTEIRGESKTGRFPKPDVLADIFSLAVNTDRSVSEVLADAYDYFVDLAEPIAQIASAYAARKQANGAMDFDDLLALWLKLLRECPEVADYYQRRFEFLLVDEYQDTNRLQSDLIDLLAKRHHNVMAVGDDAQSIYSWRGADFENILRFNERYPEARVFKIETNYRSTPEILRLANAAIEPNIRQHRKVLTPVCQPGPKPARVVCGTAQEQSAFVAQRVSDLREEGIPLADMAVLYRSHFHAMELQLELTLRNIPFVITSGIRFFEQAHIKDVTAYLRLVCNPRDETAFKRVVRLLPGVGVRGADKLWRRVSTALRNEPQPPGSSVLATALQSAAKNVSARTEVAYAQFSATVAQLEALRPTAGPAQLIQLVLDAGYDDYLQQEYSNYRNRLDDLRQLAAFSDQFTDTVTFLSQLALLTNVESEDDRNSSADTDRLRLSTVHQAKGLEFGIVFVIMLAEGCFPAARALEVEDGEEEERRLFYVAVTRAKRELYLTYPLVRFNRGREGFSAQVISRFLADLPDDTVEEWDLRSGANPW